MMTGQKKWLTFGLVTVVLLAILCVDDGPSTAGTQLLAESSSQGNIVIVPIQLGRADSSGIAMVDLARETLWIYEINTTAGSHNKLKLVAARTFKYDKYLEQYNTAEPRPEQVRMLLERLAADKDEAVETDSAAEKVISDNDE